MIEAERKERLVVTLGLLAVPGIGRGRLCKLIDVLGGVEKIPETPLSVLAAVPGISRTQATTIKEAYDEGKAHEVVARIDKLGWTVLFPDDAEYPRQLTTISPVPPVLFRVGLPQKPDDKVIAIVGTRHPTEQGRIFGFGLARSLAENGIVVASGMAEGIDSVAHAGVLEAGGHTIAVWGCSLDYVYPPTNKSLAKRIRQDGTIYSEYLPGTHPDRTYFPERNRIISGLSDGVVVVEAGRKSGALITAAHALEQNRPIFAVPGHPSAPTSIGTNELIKSGAVLLTSADDVFSELPRLKGELVIKRITELPNLTPMEKEILDHCSVEPVQIDQISRAVRVPIEDLTQFLLALELKGIIRELSGKRYVLSEEYA